MKQHEMLPDVPKLLLKDTMHRKVQANIVTTSSGVLANIEEMESQALAIGLEIKVNFVTGQEVSPGDEIARLSGDPLQIIRGEECLIGIISKVSGIATAARQAVTLAGKIQVVSGGWKKVPREMKDYLRKGLIAGGVGLRMLSDPFIYFDKNYLRIFGSLKSQITTAAGIFPERKIVVQVRGETTKIEEEAVLATKLGASVIMVDTGLVSDLKKCAMALKQMGLRDKIKLAFGGGIRLNDLSKLQAEDLDIVDVGRAIIDAPMLDFKYDVLNNFN